MLSEAIYRLEKNESAKLFLEKVEDFNFSELSDVNNVIINNFWGMIDEAASMNLLENLKKCLNGKVFIGTYSGRAKSPERKEAEKVLRSNLGFIFSFDFFNDFEKCGYRSSKINIGQEYYFILEL